MTSSVPSMRLPWTRLRLQKKEGKEASAALRSAQKSRQESLEIAIRLALMAAQRKADAEEMQSAVSNNGFGRMFDEALGEK